MKTRKIILLAAIAALACVYSLQLALQGRGAVRAITLADKPDSIKIARPGGESITLSKDGDRWVIGEKKFPADQAKVDAMLKAFAEIKALGSVSASGDWARYGLDDASAVVVTAAKGGKTLRTLAAGKNSSTSQQCYARVDGGKDVLRVSGKMRDLFDKASETLRDRTVWKVPPEGITRVESNFSGAGNELSTDGKKAYPFAIAKAGDPPVWQGAPLEGKAAPSVDGGKAAAWAESLAELRLDSFAAEGTQMGDHPLGTLTLVASGKTMKLTVGAKEGDGKYLCSSSEIPYLFYLQKGTALKLAKTPDAF